MNLKKIRKPTAKKVFEEGKSVYLLPCKMQLNNSWLQPVRIVKGLNCEDFDVAVNSFEYYNCTNETGKYTHFYEEV